MTPSERDSLLRQQPDMTGTDSYAEYIAGLKLKHNSNIGAEPIVEDQAVDELPVDEYERGTTSATMPMTPSERDSLLRQQPDTTGTDSYAEYIAGLKLKHNSNIADRAEPIVEYQAVDELPVDEPEYGSPSAMMPMNPSER